VVVDQGWVQTRPLRQDARADRIPAKFRDQLDCGGEEPLTNLSTAFSRGLRGALSCTTALSVCTGHSPNRLGC
jgi:hypothetical protein